MSSSPLSSLNSTPEKPTWLALPQTPFALNDSGNNDGDEANVEALNSPSIKSRRRRLFSPTTADGEILPPSASAKPTTPTATEPATALAPAPALSSAPILQPNGHAANAPLESSVDDDVLGSQTTTKHPPVVALVPSTPPRAAKRVCSEASPCLNQISPNHNQSRKSPAGNNARRTSARQRQPTEAAKSRAEPYAPIAQAQAQSHSHSHNIAEITNDSEAVPMTSSHKRKLAPGPANPKPAKKAALTKRKNAWAAEVVLSSERSPIVKANLREIMFLDQAWDCLSEDKKRHVLSLFPSGAKYITTAPDGTQRPNVRALSSSNSFRYDIARYQENIHLGRHDPIWLKEAWMAHHRRLQGYYDEALEDKFKKTWGIEVSPKEKKPDVEPRVRPAPSFVKLDPRASVDAARADSSLFSDPRVDLRETAAELMHR